MDAPAQSNSVVNQEALFKNRLQEYAQKAAIPLPIYHTINEGTDHAPMFRATVVINGATYTSPNVFLHVKSAEMDAARIALPSLPPSPPQIDEENCSLEQDSLDPEDNLICKSILNEYADKIKAENPIYETKMSDGLPPAFVSYVSFKGKQYVGDEGKSKKESQQLAARAVILSILDSDAHTVISKIINSKKRLSAARKKVKHPCSTQNEVMPVKIQTEFNVGTSASKGNELKAVVLNENMPRAAIPEHCTGNSASVSAKPVSLHEFRSPELEASLVEALQANGSPVISVPPNSEQLLVDSTSAKKRKRRSKKDKSKVGIDAQSMVKPPCSTQNEVVPVKIQTEFNVGTSASKVNELKAVVLNENMPRAAIPEHCTGNSASVSAKPVSLHEFRPPELEASLVEGLQANGSPVISVPPNSEQLLVDSTSAKKRKRRSKKDKSKVGIDAQVQIAAVPSSVVVNDSMPKTTISEPCTGNYTSISAKHVPLHEFLLPREEASLFEDNSSSIAFMPPNSRELAVESTSAERRKHRSTKAKNKVGIDAQVQIAAVSSSQTTTCTVTQSVPNNCVSVQGIDNAVSSEPCVLPKKRSGSEAHFLVCWRKPPEGCIALNTHGAKQSGIAAGGGVLRNHIGEHISNFYSNYGRVSLDFAESKAILDGLSVCNELGYNKIQIQTNSAQAALWFHRQLTVTVPLDLQTIWNEIYKFQDTLSIEILQVHKEGNKLAELLSKKGTLAEGMGAINISLESSVRYYLTADKMGISYLKKVKS